LARLNAAIGVRARVLPASDERLRTFVRTSSGWHSFQQFMIRERAAPAVEELEFRGAEQAQPTREVLEAIARASVIIIGPSKPLARRSPDARVRTRAGRRAPVLARPVAWSQTGAGAGLRTTLRCRARHYDDAHPALGRMRGSQLAVRPGVNPTLTAQLSRQRS